LLSKINKFNLLGNKVKRLNQKIKNHRMVLKDLIVIFN